MILPVSAPEDPRLEDPLLADGELRVPAGALVRVPPLVVHGFRNGTDAELRYLAKFLPGA